MRISTGTEVYSSNPELGKDLPPHMEAIAEGYKAFDGDSNWVAVVPFIKIGNDRKFLPKNIVQELAQYA